MIKPVKLSGRYTVIPKKTGKTYTVRLHWLLPDWERQLEGSRLRLKSPQGWLSVTVQGPEGMQICLARGGIRMDGKGDVLPHWGWYSPTYGVKQAALSFSANLTAQNSVQLTSTWQFPT